MDKRFVWFLAYFILLSACTASDPIEKTEVETPFDETEGLAAPTSEKTETTPANTPEQPVLNRRILTDEEYSFPSLIPFDGIRPIYEPLFVTANEATYQDDELVMGVAFGNEAKAYPVTVLRFREMVNDELAGIPILVTW